MASVRFDGLGRTKSERQSDEPLLLDARFEAYAGVYESRQGMATPGYVQHPTL